MRGAIGSEFTRPPRKRCSASDVDVEVVVASIGDYGRGRSDRAEMRAGGRELCWRAMRRGGSGVADTVSCAHRWKDRVDKVCVCGSDARKRAPNASVPRRLRTHRRAPAVFENFMPDDCALAVLDTWSFPGRFNVLIRRCAFMGRRCGNRSALGPVAESRPEQNQWPSPPSRPIKRHLDAKVLPPWRTSISRRATNGHPEAFTPTQEV